MTADKETVGLFPHGEVEPHNGPDKEEVVRITDAIIDACGPVDLESALTAVCNIAGQLIAALSGGAPATLQRHSASVHDHIHKVAVAKLLYDDQKRREAEHGDSDEANI